MSKDRFECPICSYQGPFEDIGPDTGIRKHARCPSCGSLERHRLQYLVVRSVLADLPVSQMQMLHFAPEGVLKNFFAKIFYRYETADLCMDGVDHKVDLEALPFADGSYDFVFASHVLEHVPDDLKAIREIRRILKPNGLAILPVPVISTETVEYQEPNPDEHYHMRAPGLDYFERYAHFFSRVVQFTSDSLPEKFQLFIYEDRRKWHSSHSNKEKHIDIVPVCYV